MSKKVNYSGEFVRSYDGMRGIDLTHDSASLTKRFGYLENMYIDYEGGTEAVESIPGYRLLFDFGKRINGIFPQSLGEGREYILVHSASELYRFELDNRDSLNSLSPIASLKDAKSRAFSHGGRLYLLDGERILSVDGEGSVRRLDEEAYVPLITRDGKALEGRNLLTSEFRAEYRVSDAEALSYGSEELSYRILDPVARTCTVTGLSRDLSGTLYIPSYAEIGGVRYLVTEIDRLAFYNREGITGIKTCRGLKRIGLGAFWGMNDLAEAWLSDTVETLGDFCFYNCASLSTLYLGEGINSLGFGLISGCSALTEVMLGIDAEGLNPVSGAAELDGLDKLYNSVYSEITLALRLSEAAEALTSLTLDGVPTPYILEDGGKRIRLTLENRTLAEGRPISAVGRLAGRESERLLVNRCTVAELFDGRVFLSGNPDRPGTVFYCDRTATGEAAPDYFPVGNEFTDGVADYGVSALLNSGGALAVFKNGDDGSGSIFYHSPSEGYPVEGAHGGVICCGAARVFLDDAVFLTDHGLFALERTGGGGAKRIGSRSTRVDPLILTLSKSGAELAEWRGYLALLLEDKILLADSRDRFEEKGALEYEWYLLSGVGGYDEKSRVFRYAETQREGYLAPAEPNEIAAGTVFSESDPNNPDGLIYYVETGSGRTEVYPTEETVGEGFRPARVLLGYRSLLFFGTEGGELCIFNSDKRGSPPEHIRNGELDLAEYERTMGRRIHPYYYDFAGVAPRYAVSTGRDSCGLPYLTKSSLRGSLTVEVVCLGGEIECEVGTDRGGYKRLSSFPSGSMSFAEGDISTLTLNTEKRATLAIPEGERDWITKEVTLYSRGFRAPIGIRALHYRYKIKGRIKNA